MGTACEKQQDLDPGGCRGVRGMGADLRRAQDRQARVPGKGLWRRNGAPAGCTQGGAWQPSLCGGQAGVQRPVEGGARSTEERGTRQLSPPSRASPPEAKAEAEVQPGLSCLPTKAQHLWGQFSPGTPW